MRVFSRFTVVWLVLLGSFGTPASAQIVTREFFIDPAQSFVQIDPSSQFVLALPAPLGTLGVPLVVTMGGGYGQLAWKATANLMRYLLTDYMYSRAIQHEARL